MPRKGRVGRKPLIDPSIEKSISLPSSLVAEVELLLYDPSTQKVKHGALSKLVERLLREWLEKGNDLPDGQNPPVKNAP